jgi:DNA polymerase I-like protein with 3'-5' exonuclease and polymerase domains
LFLDFLFIFFCVLLFQISTPDKSYIIDTRALDLKTLPEIKDILEDQKKIKLLQNAKFDYKFIKKHNIKEVEFFSLDVEGYEIEVLNGINFNDIFFHVIVVENHDQKGQKDDFSFLENFNFEKKFIINQHEFFINKDSKYCNNFLL